LRRRRGLLLTVAKKEVLEIVRDPRLLLGMILVPMLILPAMGVAMRGVMEKAVAPQPLTVGVAVLDQGGMAEELLSSPGLASRLKELNATLAYMEVSGEREAVERAKVNKSLAALLVFPREFTESLAEGRRASIKAYAFIRSVSVLDASGTARIDALLKALQEEVARLLTAKRGLEPELVLDPLDEEVSTVYRGSVLLGVSPGSFIGLLTSQLITMVLAMVIVLMLASQLVATSVASEKEQKTLETLLSLPVPRTTIIFGKLIGSLVVALLGAAGFMAGFGFYMSSVMYMGRGGLEASAAALALVLSIPPEGYALMAASLGMSLIACLSIVVVLAAFTEDVRSAQSLLSLVFLPLLFAALLTALMASSTPLASGMLLIPFTNPLASVVFILNQEYLPVLASLAVLALETIGLIYLAARFYSSERVLLARLRLRWRRG